MSFQTPMLTNAMYRELFKPFGEELISRIATHALNQQRNEEISPKQAVDEAMDILNGLLAELGRNTKNIKKKALKHRDITAVSDTDSESEDNNTKKRGRPKKIIKEEESKDLIAGMLFDDDDKTAKKEKAEAKKLAKEQAKKEKAEAKKLAKEQAKKEKAEAKRLAKEAEKLAKKQAKEAEKLAKKQAKEQAKKEKAEAKKQAKEAEKLAKKQAKEAEKLAKKQAKEEKAKLKTDNKRWYRAYTKKNTKSKALVWKPYYENKEKREKMSKKYSEKLVEVNQWKYTEKAGDKADRVILNPYDYCS